MEQKINIAELLKDCPKGLELDCVVYNNLSYDYVNTEQGRIYCKVDKRDTVWFTIYGCVNLAPSAKCVIFPKGKTTWEDFVPPYKFKDGDVLVHTQNGRFIMSIYKSNEIGIIINTHVIFWDREEGLSVGMQICCYTDNVRFATKEEKAKLFQAIKDNGYKWNPETKTLEKLIEPKFKVGDRVKHISACTQGIVVKVTDKGYHIDYPKGEGVCYVSFTLEKDYELAPNKFGITTLKPFDKVLMRSSNAREWVGTFYSHYSNNKFYGCGMCCDQCVPYEENQHLLGTTNDCEEYYKNW